jgi:hypothetical protein
MTLPAQSGRLIRIGRPSLAALIGLAWILFCTHRAAAGPVNAETAATAFRGWLHIDGRPLGNTLSATINATEGVKDASGNVVYYVVHLAPYGYAIVSADDRVEPIVAFSARGVFDPKSADTAAALVNRDLPRRIARIRGGVVDAAVRRARVKWKWVLLGSPGDPSPPDSETNGNIVTVSEVRVAPFVQTLWNQTTDESGNFACYNYYTPPGPAGDANNYPCGCVATAMAQVMYYFQYPTAGVGTGSYPITVNGAAATGTLRGGDGTGGPYQWSNMPLVPNVPGIVQAEAVGALNSDAGVSVNMDYEAAASSAYFHLAQQALTTVFQYSNAAYDEDDDNGLGGTNLLAMIGPSLDARLPVVLGIEPDGGHCLVVDGYGYSVATLFHHLNTGWGGDDDIWYALPAIDTSDNGDYTMVVGCMYNIYASGTGEIISGRVTDPSGAPISGASITASRQGGGAYAATTDSNGIYALPRLPSASAYTLTATNAGDAPASGDYSTGTSTYNGTSGNVWGANFVLSPSLLAIPETGFSAIGHVGGPFNMDSQVFVLTNTSAVSVNWALANTNSWLSATSSGGTVPGGGASTLTISLSASATSLPAGTANGTLWITNLGSQRAQALQFALTLKDSDYPISVTGYNQDVVVENAAIGGNTTLYAVAFDPRNGMFYPETLCFYEEGLVATNTDGGMAEEGLPDGGLFTSAVDNATTFQLGPYTDSNVLYLTAGASSGALTLDSPLAYKSLSVLAASADGGGNGSMVIHFADDTSSAPISFDAGNYFVASGGPTGAAISQFGIAETGDVGEFYVFEASFDYPCLYQTSIDLKSLGLDKRAINSVTFTMPDGPTATGVFALSGTESPSITNLPVSFVTGRDAPQYSGGDLILQLTNLAGQGPVVIDASTDLLHWVPVFTNPAGFGTFIYTDSAAGTFGRRFYRAATP